MDKLNLISYITENNISNDELDYVYHYLAVMRPYVISENVNDRCFKWGEGYIHVIDSSKYDNEGNFRIKKCVILFANSIAIYGNETWHTKFKKEDEITKARFIIEYKDIISKFDYE